ncbi:MAG: hypothetical protein PHN66_01620 [Candidatus Shapirobacteria bacterium]|nr:hypothetical protein [Candidatus Shapirobacteria bacterium]
MDSKNMKFLIPSIILLILSSLGIFFIFKINNSAPTTNSISTPTPIPTKIPTQIPTITTTPVATSASKITITPTATPSTKIKTTPTPTLTPIPTIISNILNFKTTDDSFSIDYSSSRKLYQDTESSGNRYTFYTAAGNFAVHVTKSGTWAWTNPDRNFSSTFLVSSQNTYRYDISTQTIVDLQSSTKNYTIQCVHNGKESLKTECEEFIKSFQLL